MHLLTSSKYWADFLGASLFLESAELEKYLWEAVCSVEATACEILLEGGD